MSEADDQRLLNNLRAGHPDASVEFVRNHYQAVYRFLVHLTRDVHQAEDLTQETFAAAWEKIGIFENRASLATWLHRITYSKCIDAQRRERRTAGILRRLIRPKVSSTDPFDSVMADEESRRLYQTLQALDAQERTLLVLHYLQGLSYREMASVLNQPTGTVKWRTAEALNQLRALLSDEVSNHAPRTTTSESGSTGFYVTIGLGVVACSLLVVEHGSSENLGRRA